MGRGDAPGEGMAPKEEGEGEGTNGALTEVREAMEEEEEEEEGGMWLAICWGPGYTYIYIYIYR